MFFFFKRSIITVDAFTNNAAAYHLYPITSSIKMIPDWWKSMQYKSLQPSSVIQDLDLPTSTLKNCPGIIDLYRLGICLPLWGDLVLNNTDDRIFGAVLNGPPSDMHPRYQYDPGFKEFNHIKLSSPWNLVERSGIKWLELPTLWNTLPQASDLHVLLGSLSFNLTHSTNVNIFMKKTQPQVLHLKAGTPITQLVPLSEKKVSLKLHQLTDIEFYEKFKLSTSQPSLTNIYRKRVRLMGNRCPFKT
jgi:hypothetical protein